MSQVFDFHERLEWSHAQGDVVAPPIIKAMIPSCESVTKTDKQTDRDGADYIARLKGGRELRIDMKLREKGCSEYWKKTASDELIPEVVIERWNVIPSDLHPGKIGWSLDPTKNTDLVLFVFDPSDTLCCFLVPFHHLRGAFIADGVRWLRDYGPLHEQETKRCGENGYKSACLFVPAAEVLAGCARVSVGSHPEPDQVADADDWSWLQ